MAKFNVGDLVVLKSGSPRMCVEDCTDETVSTVWCNDGVIGRDTFHLALMNKWEYREEGRGGDDRPRKTGWDGKPRDKKYFRKDDD